MAIFLTICNFSSTPDVFYTFRAMDLPTPGRRVSTVGASTMSPRSRDNMDTVEEKQEERGDDHKDDDDDETSSTGTLLF